MEHCDGGGGLLDCHVNVMEESNLSTELHIQRLSVNAI